MAGGGRRRGGRVTRRVWNIPRCRRSAFNPRAAGRGKNHNIVSRSRAPPLGAKGARMEEHAGAPHQHRQRRSCFRTHARRTVYVLACQRTRAHRHTRARARARRRARCTIHLDATRMPTRAIGCAFGRRVTASYIGIASSACPTHAGGLLCHSRGMGIYMAAAPLITAHVRSATSCIAPRA